MALMIRKQYKNPDGTITEVEGTEAEIESFEKKQKKKQESTERKREILHGKSKKLAAEAPLSKDTIAELKKFISDEIAKLQNLRGVYPYPWYVYYYSYPWYGYNYPWYGHNYSGVIGGNAGVCSSNFYTSSLQLTPVNTETNSVVTTPSNWQLTLANNETNISTTGLTYGITIS